MHRFTVTFSCLPAMPLALAVCLFASSCSKQEEPPTPGSEKPPANMAVVDVDNGSTEDWTLFIDGKEQGTIKPHTPVEVYLKPGKHEFRILSGQAEVDKIQTEISRGKAAVINPCALCSYGLMTATYTTGGPFTGQAPSWSNISSQRVMQADFSLFQSLPDTVVIKTPQPRFGAARFAIKTETRTKICKRAGRDMSPAEALALLNGDPRLYHNGSSDSLGMRDTYLVAIQCLDRGSNKTVIVEQLLKLIDKPRVADIDADWIIRAAFDGLKKYEGEIPQERLVTWMTLPSTNRYGADQHRIMAGARMLVARGQEKIVGDNFAALPEMNKATVMRTIRYSASQDLRKQMLSTVLQTNVTREIENEIRDMIAPNDFEPDEELARKIDNFIESMPSEGPNDAKGRKMNMLRVWIHKLCYSLKSLKSEWLTQRLLQVVELQDKGLSYNATQALIIRQKGAQVAPILPKLEVEYRKHALDAQLQQYRYNTQESAVALPLFKAGLEDEASEIRKKAFEALAEMYRNSGDQTYLGMLKSACGSERDASIKEFMNSSVKSLEGTAVRLTSPTAPSRKTQPSSRTSSTAKRSERQTPAVTDAAGWPTLAVSGVGKAGGSMTAMVNNRLVSEGDTVDGVKILSITKDNITASYNGQTKTIPVGSR